MDLNYLILAHKNPGQLRRLVSRLNCDGVVFYIHIDIRVDILPFREAFKGFTQVKFVEPREASGWGQIGMVKATLNGLERIIGDKCKGYVILLSGQDYPIRSNQQIKEYLETREGMNFISAFKFPHPTWYKNGYLRIHRYNVYSDTPEEGFHRFYSVFDRSEFRKQHIKDYLYLLRYKGARILPLLFKPRRFPRYLSPYGGSQWWALPVSTVMDILDFLGRHPDYLRYHKYTQIPDEIFFHSIVCSTKDHGSIADSLTYVHFDREGNPHPVTFKVQNFSEIEAQRENKLFARKFDEQTDAQILDLIDERLLK